MARRKADKEEQIRKELRAGRRGKDGKIYAEERVNWAAEHTDSALYKELDWDDEKIGHEHRVWQMRQLIAIYIVDEEGKRETVSLSIDRTKPRGGYRDLDDVVNNPDLEEVLDEDILKELVRLRTRWADRMKFRKVWQAIDEVAGSRPARPSKVAGRARPRSAPAARVSP